MKKYIIDVDGSKCLVDLLTGSATSLSGKKQKYYLGFLKGGHCGEGYFIPFIGAVSAPNEEIAKELLYNRGKVKKNIKNALMDYFEVPEDIFRYVILANSYDAYTAKGSIASDDILDSRKIICPEFLEKLLKNPNDEEYCHKGHFFLKSYYRNKLGASISSNFAPTKVNGKFVYSDHDRKRVMRDFFKTTVVQAMNRKQTDVLVNYYILFGGDEFNNIYIEDDHICYTHRDRDRSICTEKLEINRDLMRKLNDAQSKGLIGQYRDDYFSKVSKDPARKLYEEFDFDEETPYAGPSPIEKFNARQQKTAELQKRQAEPEGI